MRIYIAGKITGLDYQEAFAAFHEAAYEIARVGHEPLNPMKLVDQTEGRAYNEYLLEAVAHLLVSDAIYLLSNWRSSLGARIEHAIAVEKSLPIFYQETGF